MTELAFFHGLTWTWLLLAPVVFVALLLITVPYGRYHHGGWGPSFGGMTGWIVMELPAVFALPVFLIFSGRAPGPVKLVFLALWEVHYLHRTFVFPVRRRAYLEPVPAVVALLGVVFNVANGYLNGRWLGHFSPGYAATWLGDPRFLAGVVVFAAGMAINVHSDEVIFDLRRGGGGFQIPRRGVHRLVASPNYLGETLEWTGWALATWSLPGVAFAVWTFANLAPRARSHLRWYRKTFPDYPAQRKAIVPFVW
jgi:protein-S-isoprenylcysteine O-methyltransferase Ste14